MKLRYLRVQKANPLVPAAGIPEVALVLDPSSAMLVQLFPT